MFDEFAWREKADRDTLGCSDAFWQMWLAQEVACTHDTVTWEHLYSPFGPNRFGELPIKKTSGRLIDAGGGYGVASAYLAMLLPNWETVCIEPSAVAVRRAAELAEAWKSSFERVNGSLENYEGLPHSADHIHASEVIEHVEDPLRFIEKVVFLLKPDGEFTGDTPVDGCARSEQHLWFFSQPDVMVADGDASIHTCPPERRLQLRELLEKYFDTVSIWGVQTDSNTFNRFFAWVAKDPKRKET
jgi:SAM-dependent methyltransferase